MNKNIKILSMMILFSLNLPALGTSGLPGKQSVLVEILQIDNRSPSKKREILLKQDIQLVEDLVIWKNATTLLPPEWQSMFQRYSKKFDIDLDLLVAIAMNESSLNPRAVNYNKSSGTYDRGLFQINSRYESTFVKNYWNRPEKFDHFNPEHSLYMACKILVEHKARLGAEEEAIKAYNTGAVGRLLYPESAKRYYTRISSIRKSIYNEGKFL
jgi:soluble lytic murein transglycosylase-like protein